ncbi:Hypothetical_protein [Hexamita inflata]|uniref:Hypothetical_protein n=1 Tax=Hexamita inflata TaxID=28002 RepID=A0AA86UCD1_9EUKA|nr:Hypothetical protein HINF_LOCUS40065 [Hexamita inflata]
MIKDEAIIETKEQQPLYNNYNSIKFNPMNNDSHIKLMIGYKSQQIIQILPYQWTFNQPNKSYNQVLDGTLSTTLYADIDDQGVDLKKQLYKLCNAFDINQLYIVKNSLYDKYHIFSPDIIFHNISNMKLALSNIKGLQIDFAVYGSTSQRFRFIHQSKNFDNTKGIYNQFMIYNPDINDLSNLQISDSTEYWQYMIHQNYQPNQKYIAPKVYNNNNYATVELDINVLRLECKSKNMNATENTFANRQKFIFKVFKQCKSNKLQTKSIIKTFIDEHLFKPNLGTQSYEQYIDRLQ